MASKRYYRKNGAFAWQSFGEKVSDITLYCNVDTKTWWIIPNGVDYFVLLERLRLTEASKPDHSSFREVFDAVRELRSHLANLAKIYVRTHDDGPSVEIEETVAGHVYAVMYYSDYNNLSNIENGQ
jgi:hypothetical protein